jgi:hypothetical protein
MTENRIFIYTDSDGKEIAKAAHDSSIIASLPRVGDDIIDNIITNFEGDERIKIHAIVLSVEFHYELGSVVVYAKVLRKA